MLISLFAVVVISQHHCPEVEGEKGKAIDLFFHVTFQPLGRW